MKEFIDVMKRFLPPFKRQIVFNFIFNILSALFAVFSVAMMYPILEILFGTAEDVYTKVPMELSKDAIVNNFEYYITSVKINYGPGIALLYVGLFLIVATGFKVGFTFLAAKNAVFIRNGIVKNLRGTLYNKIMKLPLGFYSEERKGDIMARATGDVTEVENSIMTSLAMFLKNPVLILVFLISMFIMSIQLTIFVLLILPIAGYIIGQVGKSLKKSSKDAQNQMGVILGTIEETLGGLRIIKAFNAESKMEKRFFKQISEYRNIMMRVMGRYILAHPMSELLGTIVIVIIVWFGGTLIMSSNSNLDGASFIIYIGIFYQIINPAKAFSQAYYSIQKGLAAVERIDKILLAENNITDQPNAKSLDSFSHNISFNHVSFAYDDRQVINNISLDIKKGQTVALVGQSGSGKSTMVDLLPRFYDVKDGSITIDNFDIRELTLYSLRKLMGNVNQEAILFNDTIYNNITFGINSATKEEVMNAAKIANAHNFIIETEDAYDTVIGDRGNRLSGGQRQRLSIARAILANPPILILDEATSALDTESEKLVQEALEKLMKNRTTIVIAHRLSTVKNADLICVMLQGKIVEKGTHDELLKKNGSYRKLHDLQMY